MSETTLNIQDRFRSITGRVHAATAHRIVAALAADPRTIEELEIAIGRFERPHHGRGPLASFEPGFDSEPWDAGIVSIDLAGRRVSYESTYSAFSNHGQVEFHDGCAATGHWLPFHLASDWQILPESGWLPSAARPTPQVETDPVDQRRVLFGRVPEFIVFAMSRYPSLRSASPDARSGIVRELHIEWLMTPREDLGGKSPRDVLIDERHEHINRDVQNQSERWSFLRVAPPGLPRKSHACQRAGFGTAEIVLYYELVRDLLWLSAGRFSEREIPEAELPAEAEFLQQTMQDWLNDPQNEFTHPRTPAQVIDLERRRLPIKCGPGEAIIDPDCPCCQALANEEEFGPAFAIYDGSEMDDDFAFSFHRTREEWEAEQREYEEWSKKWRDQQADHDHDHEEPEFGADDIPF